MEKPICGFRKRYKLSFFPSLREFYEAYRRTWNFLSFWCSPEDVWGVHQKLSRAHMKLLGVHQKYFFFFFFFSCSLKGTVERRGASERLVKYCHQKTQNFFQNFQIFRNSPSLETKKSTLSIPFTPPRHWTITVNPWVWDGIGRCRWQMRYLDLNQRDNK